MAFAFAQFLEIFEIRDNAGNPYVIIGGQAVNYWAETYLRAEPELATFIPFVSKDIDLVGGRNDVRQAARKLNLPAKFPHRKLMTAFAGAAVFKIGGAPANIEFVRAVPGVSIVEIRKWAVTAERDGKWIRIIDPISLLACKLVLALTVDQENRRDADHARILMLCVRAFLRETLRGVEAGDLPARGWLGAVERVLKITESKSGKQAVTKLKFKWPAVFPEAEITASQNRLIARFREKRLTQWLEKVQQQPHLK